MTHIDEATMPAPPADADELAWYREPANQEAVSAWALRRLLERLREAQIGVPEFADAEAAWDWLGRNWAETVDQLPPDPRLPVERLRGRPEPVSLRLPLDDLALAREQAAARGLGYQTYLKMLIHEALVRVGQEKP